MPEQPGMTERAVDTATDVTHSVAEAAAALKVAVERLSDSIAAARKPGMPLATISAVAREAPLASLFVAFLFGVAIARRR
jgi:hypothetical protein